MILILRRNDFSSKTREDFTVVARDDNGGERNVGRIYSGAGAKCGPGSKADSLDVSISRRQHPITGHRVFQNKLKDHSDNSV